LHCLAAFREDDRTFLALISEDLHKRDPGGIVDTDMDELPTDAMVTVDRAGISPSDVMAHRADCRASSREGQRALQKISFF
jgi:hypothetical protein